MNLADLDLELDRAAIYDAHPFKGGKLLEDLKGMTVRQMKTRFPDLAYNCAAFCTPHVYEWMGDLEDGRVFYGNISDDKVHPEAWK